MNNFASARTKHATPERLGRNGIPIGNLGDCSGAAGVEAALVLPIFLLLLLFLFEGSRFLYSRAELNFALHNTTRYAKTATDVSKEQLAAKLTEQFSILRNENLQSLEMTTTVNADYTRLVQLRVSYRFEFLVPSLTGLDEVIMKSEDKFLGE